jgi:hypothetical protein
MAVAVYTDFFRAFPPLVLLILIYFGTPFLGLELPKLAAVALGFMLNNSSYFAEVFRAGIESVPSGQMEAARSTGLTRLQALRHVIVPQATRNVLPDLVGNGIEVIKLTTIASVVALPELLRVARDAQSLLYNPSPIVLAALMYLALLWPLVRMPFRSDAVDGCFDGRIEYFDNQHQHDHRRQHGDFHPGLADQEGQGQQHHGQQDFLTERGFLPGGAQPGHRITACMPDTPNAAGNWRNTGHDISRNNHSS